MSNVIDSKTVEMRFDNQQFESGVSKSMSTLDKFQQRLSMLGNGLGSGISTVVSKIRGVDFSPLSNGVAAVTNKFSAMEVMAISALDTIAKRVTNLGINLAKSLSIDQISTGFSKYEEDINNIQTMLAALPGSTESDIQPYLDKMLWYSDETSYSYTQGMSSVAQMIAQGNDLNDSLKAVIGIYDWAADMGKSPTSGAADAAMLNIIQDMSNGYLTMQNWKSISSRGMSGPKIAQMLMDAATKDYYNAAGEVIQKATLTKKNGKYYTTKAAAKSGVEVTTENFSGQFSQKWATTPAVMEALAKYGEFTDAVYEEYQRTGDSGYEIMQRLDATGMEISASGHKAASLAKSWSDARDAVKDAVSTQWMTTFKQLIGNLGEATDFYGEITDRLLELFTGGGIRRNRVLYFWNTVYDGSAHLKEGLWALWDAASAVFGEIKDSIVKIFPLITPSKLAKITDKFRDFAVSLAPSEETLSRISGIVTNVSRVFKAFIGILGNAFNGLKNVLGVYKPGKSFGYFIDDLTEVIGKIADWTEGLEEGTLSTNKFTWIFGKIGTVVLRVKKMLIGAIETLRGWWGTLKKSVFIPLGEWVSDTISDLTGIDNNGKSALRMIFEGAIELIMKLLDWIEKATGKLKTWGAFLLDNVFIPVYNGIKDIINAVSGKEKTGKGFFGNLKDNFQSIKEFFTEGGFLGILNRVWETLKNIWGMVKEAVSGIASSIGDFLKQDGSVKEIGKVGVLGLMSAGLIKILQMLKDIKTGGGIFKKVKELIDNVSGVFESISGVIDNFGESVKVDTLKSIAKSILMIAAALLILSLIPVDKMAVAAGFLTGMLGEVIGTLKAVAVITQSAKATDMAAVAGIFTSIGVAMIAMSAALLIIGLLPVKKILTAGAVIIAVLGTLTGMVAVLGNVPDGSWKKLLSMSAIFATLAVAFVALGAFMLAAAIAIAAIAFIPADKALTAIGGLMSIIALITLMAFAINQSNSGTALLELSAALLLIAPAIIAIAAALALLSLLNSDKLMNSVLALTLFMGALTVLGVVIKETKSGTALIALAGSLAIVGVALIGIAVALDLLAAVNPDTLTNAVLALSILMAVMTVAAAALKATGATAAIVAIAGAIALLGVGVLAFGAGMLEVITALGELAVIAPLLASAMPQLTAAFIYFVENALPALGKAGAMFFVGLLQGFVAQKAALITGIVELIKMALEGVKETAQSIIDTVISLILMILHGISDNAEEIATTLVDILYNFIIGAINGLADRVGGVAEALFNLGLAFIDAWTAQLERTGELMSHIHDLVMAHIDAILAVIDGSEQIFKDAVQKIKDWMSSKFAEAPDWAKTIGEFIKEIPKKVKEFISDCVEAGKDLIKGIKEGIANGTIMGDILDKIKGLGAKIVNKFKEVLGINSPSKVFEELAEFTLLGIPKGFDKETPRVLNSMAGVADAIMQTASDEFSNSMNQPVIKPIVDLSEVQNGINSVRGMSSSFGAYGDFSYHIGSLGSAGSVVAEVVDQAVGKLQKAVDNLTAYAEDSSGVVNNFYINGAQDPKLVAKEVEIIIQKSIRQKGEKWGK